MEKKLRIGVIGLGIMGEQYVRIYQRYPLSEWWLWPPGRPKKHRQSPLNTVLPCLCDLAGTD